MLKKEEDEKEEEEIGTRKSTTINESYVIRC